MLPNAAARCRFGNAPIYPTIGTHSHVDASHLIGRCLEINWINNRAEIPYLDAALCYSEPQERINLPFAQNNARTLDQPGEPGVITGRPAAFQAPNPPPMCAAWRCPAARRRSAAVNDRLPLPQ